MDIENYVKELESYRYEYEYLKEKTKELEKLKLEIEKSFNRLTELQNKNIDIKNLNSKIKKIIEKQSLEETQILNILSKKQKIENQINCLDQPYKTIFFLRYIRANTFDEIALKMNYSTKRIYQLHKIGIDEYIKLMQNSSLN